MLDAGRPRRLILAYLIVAMAAVALIGALIGSRPVMGLGGVFAYLFATIHAISFMVRMRKRRTPALLDPTGRVILAVTLGAIASAVIGNLATVTMVLRDSGRVVPAQLVSLSVWMTVTGVLCWRAWIVPSARRAALLQLVAVMFALPSVFGPIVDATSNKRMLAPVGPGDAAALLTAMFIGFAVVCCAGPVLDRLFAGTPDRDEVEVLPEAVLRA